MDKTTIHDDAGFPADPLTMAVGARATPARGIHGDTQSFAEHNCADRAPVSQRDYLQLLLAQERRLENLEQENRKLLAERDVLQEKFQAQLQIVAAIRSGNAVSESGSQGSDVSAGRPEKRLSLPEARTTRTARELPMIDAAEFQPVQDPPHDPLFAQTYKLVAGTTTAVAGRVGSSVKSSAVWCGSKLFAILT